MKLKQIGCKLVIWAGIVGGGVIQAAAVSTFNVNAEGWTIVGNVSPFSSGAVTHQISGGNPGGHIRAGDPFTFTFFPHRVRFSEINRERLGRRSHSRSC